MSRRSGIRFADEDMRQYENLRRFPVISDHRVIRYDRKSAVAYGAPDKASILTGSGLPSRPASLSRLPGAPDLVLLAHASATGPIAGGNRGRFVGEEDAALL